MEKRIAADDLRRCYVDNDQATMKSAAKVLECSPRCLRRELVRLGFKPRDKMRNFGKRAKDKRLLDRAWLTEQMQSRTLVDIGRETAVTPSCVRSHAIRHGIVASSTEVAIDPKAAEHVADKKWMKQQVAKKPMMQIADELGMSYTNVRNAIIRFGITLPARKFRRRSPTRSASLRTAIKKTYPNGRVGEQHPNWRGGRYKLKQSGYVKVYSPAHPHRSKQNTVFEHRLVMEAHIGRHLTPKEVVHHKNGIRDDNRIENLELVESTGKHVSDHFKKSHRVHELEARVAELEAQLASCTCQNKASLSN